MRLLSRLNRLSLAKSVVGLAVIFLGGDNRRPPYVPEIMRISKLSTLNFQLNAMRLFPVTCVVVRSVDVADLQTGIVL